MGSPSGIVSVSLLSEGSTVIILLLSLLQNNTLKSLLYASNMITFLHLVESFTDRILKICYINTAVALLAG